MAPAVRFPPGVDCGATCSSRSHSSSGPTLQLAPRGKGRGMVECVRLAGLSGGRPALTRMAGAAATGPTGPHDAFASWARLIGARQLPPDRIDRGAGTLGVELRGEPSVLCRPGVDSRDQLLELIHVDIDHGGTTGSVARSTDPEDGCRPVATVGTPLDSHNDPPISGTLECVMLGPSQSRLSHQSSSLGPWRGGREGLGHLSGTWTVPLDECHMPALRRVPACRLIGAAGR